MISPADMEHFPDSLEYIVHKRSRDMHGLHLQALTVATPRNTLTLSKQLSVEVCGALPPLRFPSRRWVLVPDSAESRHPLPPRKGQDGPVGADCWRFGVREVVAHESGCGAVEHRQRRH